MAIITEEKMRNLDRDIEDAGKSINIIGIINPRYGAPFPSIPMVIRDAQANIEDAMQEIVASTELKSAQFMDDLATRYLALSLKGDWTPNTPYVVKDLVFVNNITYICLLAHTSSSSFQNDQNAGKWAVYQGVTQVDLQSYVAMNKTYAPVLGSPVKFKLNPLMASFLYGISDQTHKDDDLNNFRGLNNPDAYHDSNVAIGAVSFGRNNPPFAYLSLAGGHDCVPFGVASFVFGAGSCTGNPDDPVGSANGLYGYCSLSVGKNTQARGRISNAMGERCLSESRYSSTDGYKCIAGKVLPSHPDYNIHGGEGEEGAAARAHGFVSQAYGNFAFAYGSMLAAYNGAQVIGKGINEGSPLIISKRGLGLGYNVDVPTIFCQEGPGENGAHAWVGFNTAEPLSKYDFRLGQSDTVIHHIEAEGNKDVLTANEIKGKLGDGSYASLYNVIVTHPNAGQPYATVQYRINGTEFLTIDPTRRAKFNGAIETSSGLYVEGNRLVGGQMPAIANLPPEATLSDVITKLNELLVALRDGTGHGLIAK
ncbi:UNVERIFIED_CONTAM: hypothetical protein KWE62_03475 [Acinetobacter baumannii]|uniref:carbohydrate-binding protein n=1 Tax=Acinetobacter baumannii TaxID=470 RepID=UPI0022EB9F5B|nr:hypothetical protein [Acinetobacter baumannii]MDA3583787.1 hypothetical protein [Acinetobacter baumannii]MDQ9952219.1 hypothetical protein [Acinetobacter baumannii]